MTKVHKIPVRIAMWSTPRSLSTALMRSWENRPDTIVIDEPFNGVDIVLSNLQYEGRESVVTEYETDWRKVVSKLFEPLPKGKTISYQKHFAQHTAYDEITLDWIYGLKNCFLIRNPKEVISSYLKKWPEIHGDLGFIQLLNIFNMVKENTNVIPPVIDAKDLQNNPKETLNKLCKRLEIPFEESMLSWKVGTRKTDGPWKKRGWYDKVSQSTAFEPYKEKNISIRIEYEELCKEGEKVYEELKKYILK